MVILCLLLFFFLLHPQYDYWLFDNAGIASPRLVLTLQTPDEASCSQTAHPVSESLSYDGGHLTSTHLKSPLRLKHICSGPHSMPSSSHSLMSVPHVRDHQTRLAARMCRKDYVLHRREDLEHNWLRRYSSRQAANVSMHVLSPSRLPNCHLSFIRYDLFTEHHTYSMQH